jgi:hypothetical protein
MKVKVMGHTLFMLVLWNPDLQNDSYRFIRSSVNWDSIALRKKEVKHRCFLGKDITFFL